MSRVDLDVWRREVYRSPQLTDGTKVLLLYFADRAKANKTVSVPTPRITRDLGMGASRISERVKQAKAVGFLGTISPGVRGRTAVYDLLLPSGIRNGTNDATPIDSFRSAGAMRLRNPEGNGEAVTLNPASFVPDSGVPVVRTQPVRARALWTSEHLCADLNRTPHFGNGVKPSTAPKQGFDPHRLRVAA